MNKRIFQALFFPFLMFLLFTVSACEKTYSGKVIDADTKEPIEGAVVVASWREQGTSLAGAISTFKDVKENLTDKDGKWTIVGLRETCNNPIALVWQLLGGTCIKDPEFIVFKPGYCSWPKGFFIDACDGKIQPEGNSKVAGGKPVELSKLTEREDRLKAQGIYPDVDAEDEKIPNFIRLQKEERRYLGLDAT